jgi:uncharacterized protein (TIGR02271 family)
MSQSEIEDIDGIVATIHGVSIDESSLIGRLPDNTVVTVPIQFLKAKNNQRYILSRSFQDFTDEILIPVVKEEPVIKKRKVDRTRIKIKKSVTEEPKSVQENLASENYDIKRMPLGEIRETPAEVRIEGDVTIIPVQEEILVTQKKILVREEIHIRKFKSEKTENVTVNLKKEEVTIDRKKIN